MDKFLELKIDVGGGAESTPFPNENDPIIIGAFRYDAKRMGGAPTITASVNYPTCLDNEWTDTVYAEFNGEKYYLKQTPTSSYDNESVMYKHNVELVSERFILDNVYFFDTVVGDPQGEDKPVSNSTKVVFFGDVREFVARLNSSLEYSGLDYTVVVDKEIETEEKLMSFEDKFFSNVLQEIYNTYKVPYYFEGKTIHIGYSNKNDIIPTLEYGVDNALLSITKNNANYKIVNRATATGSSENIPFYYPNNSPKGEIAATSSNAGLSVTIVDTELYSNKVKLDGVITRSNIDHENLEVEYLGESIYSGDTFSAQMGYGGISKDFFVTFDAKDVGELSVSFASKVTKYTLKDVEINDATLSVKYYMSLRTPSEDGYPFGREVFTSGTLDSVEDVRVPIVKALDGYRLKITVSYATIGKYAGKGGRIVYDASFDFGSESGWTYEGNPIELKDVGLKVEGTPSVGDTITQTLVKYVKTSQNLMPSIYRKTGGKERFYNAVDGLVDENDNEITFNNPYVEGHPKEHIITVEDIKPTIKEATNDVSWAETDEEGNTKTVYQRMDMFSEFAYDLDDNDETVEDENGDRHFVHSYFFAKLRKLDFNLFEHAIENQPMTISFTSGDCGACNFEIGVTEEFPQKNPVQVNADGTLKRDANGRVICGQFEDITEDECQPQQQDTINNEVWIALKKEEETYGILMPKAPKFNDAGEQIEAGHRPKACSGKHSNDGDTFVILGINLPQSYIINAEKKLEAEIIKYLQDNNNEKFTFSIDFSRIYFEENEIHDQLSENSKIAVMYNGQRYELYVSSFSYSMSEGDVLPDIRVELDETLQVSQNALQNAISQVKSELGRVIGNIDVFGATSPFFLRKDADDEAQGTINFKKGVKFGEGGKVEILDNNSAKLSIEYLEVTKKATFTSLEIQEKTHVGGQILVTPAAINCGEVEEFDDFYRCYFQTKGVEGDEIFNQFAVGDQAICQTYNAWGSKYYWRLVTGIGEDYIDLSKVEGEYDEESGIPSAGDKIIQLGNQVDGARQNAIVIAAYGDGSPYIIQYKGIDSFELSKDKMVTKLASDENIFTGKVHMQMGSDGLENINGGLNIGGQNLLRNSGFTGDYLSEPLADREVMEASKKLFSDPLDHWKDDDTEDGVDMESWGAEVIELVGVSTSGYGASLNDVTNEDGTTTSARLYQNLYYDLIGGETYVLSFKAMGSAVTCIVGDYTEVVSLTDEWAKYTIKATPSVSSKVFSIVGTGVTLCEIQLERGTMATSWGMSPLDNSSDRTYYESIKYLSQSMVEEAITEGATDVLGGVVLTNHIKVGNYANKTMIKETGGVSGTYTDDDSVAFWGGGDFASAMEAVSKFKDNPTYQPTEEELASMANFVVTHGGRAILNDIILRGYVYAEGGEFNGIIKANGGKIGSLYIIVNPQTGGTTVYSNDDCHYGRKDTTSFSDESFLAHSSWNNTEGTCMLGYETKMYGVGFRSYRALKNAFLEEDEGEVADIVIEHDQNQFDGTETIFKSNSGVFEGLRPSVRITTASYIPLDEFDHTVIIKNSTTATVVLQSNPRQGQTYRLLHTTTNGVTIDWNGKSAVNIATGSAPNSTFSARRTVVLTYHDGTWYAEYIELVV